MSVQRRLERYWINDEQTGHRIFKDLTAKGISLLNWDHFELEIRHHRLNGKMRRWHKKYKRLNRKHECRMIRKMAMFVISSSSKIEGTKITGMILDEYSGSADGVDSNGNLIDLKTVKG